MKMMKAKSSPAPDSWQTEDDLRTCQAYAKLSKDPKRMAAVRKLAKEKLAEIQAVVAK